MSYLKQYLKGHEVGEERDSKWIWEDLEGRIEIPGQTTCMKFSKN